MVCSELSRDRDGCCLGWSGSTFSRHSTQRAVEATGACLAGLAKCKLVGPNSVRTTDERTQKLIPCGFRIIIIIIIIIVIICDYVPSSLQNTLEEPCFIIVRE